MCRHLIKHVVIEGDPRRDLPRGGTVEIDCGGDLRLFGVAHDLGATRRRRIDENAERGERHRILRLGADGEPEAARRGVRPETNADAERAQPVGQLLGAIDLEEQEVAAAVAHRFHDRRLSQELGEAVAIGLDPRDPLLLHRAARGRQRGHRRFDAEGRQIAAAVFGGTSVPPPSNAWHIWLDVLFLAAASLAAASLFALASSSLVSYFLSRRLVRRLERLGRAVESFAAGDLSGRVDSASNDEVGELVSRFNSFSIARSQMTKSGRNLSATSRSSTSSRASQTTPIPPRPKMRLSV